MRLQRPICSHRPQRRPAVSTHASEFSSCAELHLPARAQARPICPEAGCRITPDQARPRQHVEWRVGARPHRKGCAVSWSGACGRRSVNAACRRPDASRAAVMLAASRRPAPSTTTAGVWPPRYQLPADAPGRWPAQAVRMSCSWLCLPLEHQARQAQGRGRCRNTSPASQLCYAGRVGLQRYHNLDPNPKPLDLK